MHGYSWNAHASGQVAEGALSPSEIINQPAMIHPRSELYIIRGNAPLHGDSIRKHLDIRAGRPEHNNDNLA